VIGATGLMYDCFVGTIALFYIASERFYACQCPQCNTILNSCNQNHTLFLLWRWCIVCFSCGYYNFHQGKLWGYYAKTVTTHLKVELVRQHLTRLTCSTILNYHYPLGSFQKAILWLKALHYLVSSSLEWLISRLIRIKREYETTVHCIL